MIRNIARMRLAAALLLTIGEARGATLGNPTKLQVKLFKTEIIPVTVADNGSYTLGTPAVVFDGGATGVAVDLVGNAGGVFGQGDVPVGRYDRIRLTISNTVTYSTGAIDTCSAVTDQTLKVDAGATGTAEIPLTFATAATGGGAGWYANGSDDSPLLMTSPVVVAADQTTRVNFQFDTQDSAVCDGSMITIPDAPSMRVVSAVVPSGSSFAGGSYWVSHYNSSNSAFANSDFTRTCGSTFDPYAAGASADCRALYREQYGFFLGWGMDVQFGVAASDGTGTATFGTTHLLENRHQVDETYCTDCGVVAASGGAPPGFGYAIDADHRFTMVADNGVVYGGFNEDFSVMVGIMVETGNGRHSGADLIVGVKKGTATQSLTGLYGLGMAGAEMTYPVGASVMSDLYLVNSFGWISFDADSAGDDIESYSGYFDLNDPTAAAGAGLGFDHGSKDMRQAGMFGQELLVGSNGTATLGLANMMTLWVAADQGGHTVLMAGDTGTTNSSGDPTHFVRLEQVYGLMLKQAPAGTHTLATLAGKWVWASREDELKEMDNATDAIVSKRAQYGTLTTDAAGIATVDITSMDEAGTVTGETAVGDFAVRQVCVGTNPPNGDGVGRLAWTLSAADCATAGGRMMDIGLLSAPDSTGTGSRTLAWFLFNDDGSTASILSPDGFNEADQTRTTYHLLGYALRTQG